MKKYIVWRSVWEGEFVQADDVSDDGKIVTFLQGGVPIRSFEKSKIVDYVEVEQ